MLRCAETSLRERAHPDLPGGPDPGVLQRPGGEMRSDLERGLRAKHEGTVLLDLALEIYDLQLQEGRHFLHEHPASASSGLVPRMTAFRWLGKTPQDNWDGIH